MSLEFLAINSAAAVAIGSGAACMGAARRSAWAPKLFGGLEMSFQKFYATAYNMTRPRLATKFRPSAPPDIL
eukprot:7993783-Heterocapsa_arctica.AAC.1